MEEPVDSGEQGVVDGVATVDPSVVFDMQAEGSQRAVLPEVQAARDFEVGPARRHHLAGGVAGVEVVVDEEEGIAPGVVVEAFERGGDVLAVGAEVVLYLDVGLGFRSSAREQRCRCRRGVEYRLSHNGRKVIKI